MSTSSAIPQQGTGPGPATSTPNHFFADLYTFHWDALELRLPVVSAMAVALCVFVGVAAGHPGGALISSGGALTIGFGANQRIADSRVRPMIFGLFATATAAFAGTIAGHRGLTLILFSAISAAIYGVLTVRNTGVAWVGQQASVALFVASAFPSNLHGSFQRAGLVALGGVVQILFTSAGLRLIPELRKDLLAIPRSLYGQRRELLLRLRHLPEALPAPDRRTAMVYALRMTITVVLASELYRQLKMQSGYWVPMTALLIQKPAFYETLMRGLLRIGGTLAGAVLATQLAVHVPLGPYMLAALTTLFAFLSFATNAVNYGLYTFFLTSYIVFLLSLNQTPGPEVAHRRAWCTIAGALIAFAIHVDALRRHRQTEPLQA